MSDISKRCKLSPPLNVATTKQKWQSRIKYDIITIIIILLDMTTVVGYITCINYYKKIAQPINKVNIHNRDVRYDYFIILIKIYHIMIMITTIKHIRETIILLHYKGIKYQT